MSTELKTKAKQPTKDSVRKFITHDHCPFCRKANADQFGGECDILMGDIDYTPNQSPDSIYINYSCEKCGAEWQTIFRAVGILPSQDIEVTDGFNDVYLSNWGVRTKHPA